MQKYNSSRIRLFVWCSTYFCFGCGGEIRPLPPKKLPDTSLTQTKRHSNSFLKRKYTRGCTLEKHAHNLHEITARIQKSSSNVQIWGDTVYVSARNRECRNSDDYRQGMMQLLLVARRLCMHTSGESQSVRVLCLRAGA